MKKWLKSTLMRKQPANVGAILAEWSFPEYVRYKRSRGWYIAAGVVFGLLMIYAILTINFLFAVIVMMFGFLIVFQQLQKPEIVTFKIHEDGIVIDDRYYDFRELLSYWFVFRPPVKKLYFDFKDKFKRSIVVPLHDANPLELREILDNYLDENLEQEEEFFDEAFSRIIKFQ